MHGMKVAVIGVDITNDFTRKTGGLPVPGGDEVVHPTNQLLKLEGIDIKILTRDKHSPESKHFVAKDQGGGGWPIHGIDGTWGYEFHSSLNTEGAVIVSKGMSLEDDGYSAFEGFVDETGQTLAEYLREQGIIHIIVTGLATDYCVKATCLDAIREGFKVILAIDACRAVNIEAGDGETAVAEMVAAGVVVRTVPQIMPAFLKP